MYVIALTRSGGGGWKLPGEGPLGPLGDPERRRLAIWRHAWSLHRYADHAE